MNLPEGWPTGTMWTAFEEAAGVEMKMHDFIRGVGAMLAAAPTDIGIGAIAPPAKEYDLHPATVDLVHRFADALMQKLAIAEKKYGHGDSWLSPDWMDECRAKLLEHITKGDPLDVAAYCAFLWHHGESTTPPAPGVEPVGFRLTYKSGKTSFIDRVPDSYELRECKIEPIYLHPVDDGLRKAASELLRVLNEGGNRAEAMVNLRAELDKGK